MIDRIKTKFKTNLFKNFFKYSFATLFEKMILMIVFFHIANLFGPEKYGEIAYSISILTLFSILGVLGLDTYGHREISKDRSKIKLIVTSHLFLKCFLFFIVEIILYFYTSIFESQENIKLLIMTYSIIIFLDIFNMEWIARSTEQYGSVMFAKIISSIFFISSIYLLINSDSDNIMFIFIYLFIYKFLSGTIYLIMFKQYIQMNQFNLKYIKTALLPSVTLMASYFMMTIYYHIDKIMLGNFFDKSYVGMYDVAYKIFGIFVIFNTLMWGVFSTRIANKRNLKEYKIIMFSSGLFLSIILFFLSNFILGNFFSSSYLVISSILQILSINIFAVFLNSIFVSPLMLWNKENLFLTLTILGAISNIILNIILIPMFDMRGAAIATLSSELIILFAFSFVKQSKIYLK